jgi:hypothetical protein
VCRWPPGPSHDLRVAPEAGPGPLPVYPEQMPEPRHHRRAFLGPPRVVPELKQDSGRADTRLIRADYEAIPRLACPTQYEMYMYMPLWRFGDRARLALLCKG